MVPALRHPLFFIVYFFNFCANQIYKLCANFVKIYLNDNNSGGNGREE
jgi:hypothetical protein